MARTAEARTRVVGVALDLGSTWVKAGVLDGEGRLLERLARPAPALIGDGGIREGDARSYTVVVEGLVAELLHRVPRGTPLGVASQRSTFLLWDRNTGEPLTPMISWQDRRAADWCARHATLGPDLTRRTGLVLSAHYVGPKLAALVERDAAWRQALADERTLFGTLDAFLIWRLTGGRIHEIDLTMAARTALLDLERGDWSDELLVRLNLPRKPLPRVRPTCGWSAELLNGLVLRTTIADQAAGLLALFDEHARVIVINVGTGAFIMRPTSQRSERLAGYLTAPILDRGVDRRLYAVEGTINGAGSTVDRFGDGPTELLRDDTAPAAFCLPDAAGLGSPYWKPEVGLTLSPAADGLAAEDRRRVALEGLLFRVRQIVDDLRGPGHMPRVLLAGGLSREPFVARGLAALLGRPVELLDVHEGGLIGCGRLALGLAAFADADTRIVQPSAAGRYLHVKYGNWRGWLQQLLNR